MHDDNPLITPEKFEELMRAFCDGDPENDHRAADELMCEVLHQIGYGAGVKVFVEMKKWYA